jgi:hypothetical protein
MSVGRPRPKTINHLIRGRYFKVLLQVLLHTLLVWENFLLDILVKLNLPVPLQISVIHSISPLWGQTGRRQDHLQTLSPPLTKQ